MEKNQLNDLLKSLAITANNCIMKGSFSGDDIHEASRVMMQCKLILEQIESDEKEHTRTND
jgi:hypothetical protein